MQACASIPGKVVSGRFHCNASRGPTEREYHYPTAALLKIMKATTKVVDLAELRGEDEFPKFAAIYSPPTASPFVLSPGAMRWIMPVSTVRPALVGREVVPGPLAGEPSLK